MSSSARRFVAALAFSSALCAVASVDAAAGDGDLDTRFNHDTIPAVNGGIGRGSLTVDFDNLAGTPSFDVARGIAKLPDGKYLVAALVNPGANGKVGLVRLNADGTRDTSFGSPGSLGRILRSGGGTGSSGGVLSVAGPVVRGNRAYYAYTTEADYGGGQHFARALVCRIDFDGVPDTNFRSWGFGNNPSAWPAGCSIADTATLGWGAEVSDMSVEPSFGYVVTALTYRQGSAADAPTNGAFTWMNDVGKDDLSGVSLDLPQFKPVTADGDFEAARRVHFSRVAGASEYDFFLAFDYQPSDGSPHRAALRHYHGITQQQEVALPALSPTAGSSIGALAFETGPGNLGFDAFALVVANVADGDVNGALMRPALTRVPIAQGSSDLQAGATTTFLDGFCTSAAALGLRESCLVTAAQYDPQFRQLWLAGSWRIEGSAIYDYAMVGRLQRAANDWYALSPLASTQSFRSYAFNASLGETRRHWGAAMLLDNLQPVIAGDRQLNANDPGNVNHDVLVFRLRGADRIFDDGLEF